MASSGGSAIMLHHLMRLMYQVDYRAYHQLLSLAAQWIPNLGIDGPFTIQSLEKALSGIEAQFFRAVPCLGGLTNPTNGIAWGKSSFIARGIFHLTFNIRERRLAIKPLKFAFSEQARMSADLYALVVESRKLRILCNKFNLFWRLKYIRAKELYNSTLRRPVHDLNVRERLKKIQAHIEYCGLCMRALEMGKFHLRKEEVECSRHEQFATLLATLGAPIKFFQLPGELRNQIYGYLIPSGQTLHVTTFRHATSALGPWWDYGRYQIVPENYPARPGSREIESIFEKSSREIINLLRVSRLFRFEVGSLYYSKNIFTCRNIYNLEHDLGLKVLPKGLRDCLEKIDLTWASLGQSTVEAVKALMSLRGLKTLNLYISWTQVLGYDRNSRAGVAAFKCLLACQDDPTCEKKINIFRVPLSICERHVVDYISRHPRTITIRDPGRIMYRDPREVRWSWGAIFQFCIRAQGNIKSEEFRDDEILINNMLTERLMPEPDYKEIEYEKKCSFQQCEKPELMTAAQVEEKLAQVLLPIERREMRERVVADRARRSSVAQVLLPIERREMRKATRIIVGRARRSSVRSL